ncbi:hypothetical protein EKO04_007776 [Ascochyta lentis]|uniref:Peptidase C14 caspase domain-containing protein n=1 Tax=Ascochyta lentis TaxID=205686 RepID=A0A8H7J2W6_9PLEO|nr:hypothetical protein EKO04_007776 [Ascochyta lentis]
MATQRQSAVQPVLTVQADFARSPIGVQPPPRIVEGSPAEKGNEAVLYPGDEASTRELDREVKRRAAFEKVSNKIYKVPDYYRKVEVLIIRWEESIDEFKEHNDEINRLKLIFSLGYNYSCRVARIKAGSKTQIDLNYEILKHVHDHDSDDTLLIVYYTGHGEHIVDKDGSHHLNLSATRDGVTATACWDEAEDPLRTKAGCDVLAILDCCFASAGALKGVDDKFRTYQLLAASPADGVTNGPGKSSFTTALCDSLEALLKELDGSAFPVLELFQRINLLRPSRPALLWDRLKHGNGRSVNLGKLEQKLKRPTLAPEEESEKASLLLRLSLKKTDLDLEDIANLARRLPTTSFFPFVVLFSFEERLITTFIVMGASTWQCNKQAEKKNIDKDKELQGKPEDVPDPALQILPRSSTWPFE